MGVDRDNRSPVSVGDGTSGSAPAELTKGQSLAGMTAEIAGRGSCGENLLTDASQRDLIIQRAQDTVAQIAAISSRGVNVSPFLEIGSGLGQRSIALMKHFGSCGVAAEISLGNQRDAPHVARILHHANLPLRICCDAQNLPFQDNTFPFAFCFQTLHHFPDPSPVVSEVYRTRGLCIKDEGETPTGDFADRLLCLDCRNSRLKQTPEFVACNECNRRYPIVDGILVMFPEKLELHLSSALNI